jgi:hypothetical protein
MSHTTGSWKVSQGNTGRYRAPTIEVITQHDSGVDQCLAVVSSIAAGRSNACLMASAPDLLAALESIMKTVAGCEKEPHWEAARAAIAKAKGQT